MASNGNKKHGRSKGSPSHTRYVSERRWEINAAKRQARHKKRMARAKAKAVLRASRYVAPAFYEEVVPCPDDPQRVRFS